MKFLWLFPALATSVVGIPRGRVVRRDGVSSQSGTPGSTSARSSTSNLASSTVASSARPSSTGDVARLCDLEGVNQANWKKYDVDTFLEECGSYFPTNFMNDQEITDDTSFPVYMVALQGNIQGAIECTAAADSDCNIYPSMSREECMGTDVTASEQPKINAILANLYNFHAWQNSLRDALKQSEDDLQALAINIVSNFTNHEIPSSGANNWISMVVGLLIMVVPFVGQVGKLAEQLVGGGLVGGLVTSSAAIGATTANAAEIVQQEFETVGNVQDWLSSLSDQLSRAIEQMAKTVLETSPLAVVENDVLLPSNKTAKSVSGTNWQLWNGNDSPSYDDERAGAVQILKGGAFCNQMTSTKYDALASNIKTNLAAAALNWLWAMQSVMIVKITGDIYGDAQSNMIFNMLDSDCKVCVDDDKDGTCYYFIVAQPIGHWSTIVDMWLNPYGCANVNAYLDEFHLDFLSFAQGAESFQAKWGAYMQTPSTDALLGWMENLTADSTGIPSGGYIVNLPVVDWSDAPEVSSSDSYYATNGLDPSTEDRFLSTVAKYVGGLDNWPDAYSNFIDP